MKNIILTFYFIFFVTFVTNAISQTIGISDARITRILIDSINYGGCMILTDKKPSNYGLNCPSTWLSLDCLGKFYSKDSAFRKLDQVQMAMALEKDVYLLVDDSKTYNTKFCVVQRVDIY